MFKNRTARALALTSAAVALGISLTGCSAINGLLGSGDAPRDDEGNVTEEANIDVFSLSVGDCMPESDTTGEITDVDVVKCTEPHVDEVFYEFELPDGDLPSDDEITAAVEKECVPAFNEYVGSDYYEESTLDFWWITPTADTWSQLNDRLVQCIVYQPDPEDPTASVEVTASFKDSGL